MIEHVFLGGTGIQVSRIGLGTVKFGRNQGVHYPKAFELPSDQAILELLDCAKELGVNLLDTAPAYGLSEERLGKLLRGQRSEWILSTKVGEQFINGQSVFDFSSQAMQESIEKSLQRLQTDYLDIVLVHSNGDDKKIIEQDEVFETLNVCKKAGKIRAYGMSTKTVSGGLLAVDLSDVVMATYNPLHAEEKSVIVYAHKKNKGIFIKKALASGYFDDVHTALKFIFAEPGVSSIILGTLNKEHLYSNIDRAKSVLGELSWGMN